jgi:3-phytase
MRTPVPSLLLMLAPSLILAQEPPSVAARVDTPVLHQYEDAPRTPDADDPAIWLGGDGGGFVIGVLKDAGLQVYDLAGQVVQTINPPNRPAIAAEDPPAPGPVPPDPGTGPCPESEEGDTFGRFNNVDVQYDFRLRRPHGGFERVDIAVVTDRGCDRLRIYRIDAERTGGPLFEITAPGAGRVFPMQFVQPSPLQPSGEGGGFVGNPLDDQNTAYGLGLYRARAGHGLRAIVSQRNRSVLVELELFDTGHGTVGYRRVREYRFDPVFRVPNPDGPGHIRWTPCREEAAIDPQFEGIVVDRELGILYAAQEVVGIWKLPLHHFHASVVTVSPRRLVEPVKSWGAPWWAIPDGDEFSCEDEAPTEQPPGTVVAPGNPSVGGEHLQADAEGLAIYYGHGLRGYLIASSQGDDTFHVYSRLGGFTRATANRWRGEFKVEGAGETDGHDVVNVPVGESFTQGLFVMQNGQAPPPDDTGDINGFAYDGSTQFKLVGWEDIARAFEPPLRIDTEDEDRRR